MDTTLPEFSRRPLLGGALVRSSHRPHSSRVLVVLGALMATGLLPLQPATASGPHRLPARSADRAVYRRLPGQQGPGAVAGTRPHLIRAQSTAAATSQWTVHFTGTVPSGAADAFQAAVTIWSRLVTSSVPIQVDADFQDLGPGILGAAGPTSSFSYPQPGYSTDTIYPVALLNAKLGSDQAPSESDISATFTNSDPNIYYGTDGHPPANDVDFETIVLHELAHGLGFLGLMDVNGNSGSWDAADAPPLPAIFDRFTAQISGSAGQLLTSFTNPSTALGTALTSDQIYWTGQFGTEAFCGVHPQLYAPSPWEPGSSYSHLSDTAFPDGDPNALMTPGLLPGRAIHDPGPITLGIFADMGWQSPVSSCSNRYTPLDPVRLLDTRSTSSPRVGPGGFIDVQIAGVHGVPADAQAAVLNVTGTGPTKGTDVRVFPTPTDDSSFPNVSNLNLRQGETRANLVTVALGQLGRVRLRNAAGSVALLADLAGYYEPTGTSGYHPVTPVRILNTFTGPQAQRIGQSPVDLQVTGTAGVPASATAVAVTITAVGASTGTDVRAYPMPSGADAVPVVSNLNLTAGPPVPNAAIVKVGATGKIRLRNAAGLVSLIVDLSGWYDPTSGGDLFRAVRPQRLLDTRPTRLGPASTVDVAIVGPDIANTVDAAVLNVTGVQSTGGTDVRVYPKPADASYPNVSNLNLDTGQTNADLVFVTVGAGGTVRLRNNGSGSIALLADLSGWFGP